MPQQHVVAVNPMDEARNNEGTFDLSRDILKTR